MDHNYHIEGHINGRHIAGDGRGCTDPSRGLSEMEVRFQQLAEGWDPRTIVLMCCDRSTIMASREEGGAVGMYRASGGYLTIGRHLLANRTGVMRDVDGQIMVSVQARSETDFRGSRWFDRSWVEGGISHVRPGHNGIATVRPFDGTMMQSGPAVVVVTTRYEAILEDGTTLYGSTFYPHFLPEQRVQVPGIQLLHVESVEQELTGTLLWVRVRSSVTSLAGAFDLSTSGVAVASTR